MTFAEVLELIGSYGFPIIACVVMAWYTYKQGIAHREEVAELRRAVDANTAVVNTLVSILGGVQHDERE